MVRIDSICVYVCKYNAYTNLETYFGDMTKMRFMLTEQWTNLSWSYSFVPMVVVYVEHTQI